MAATSATATDWARALEPPVAFVFSGGASQGSIQVGMLHALAEVGVEPDLVAGTSVGALHAAVLAETPDVAAAADRLEEVWSELERRQVLGRSWLGQAVSVWRTGYLTSSRGLERLIASRLSARRFADLRLPLTVVTADVLSGHVRWLDDGDLVSALLAATAIPGVFPPIERDGAVLWDAGSIANVPLQAAVAAGARSIVVLDAGDVCHLDVPPRGIPDAMLLALGVALRQRVLVEAPTVAATLPVLYLPRPCLTGWKLLDFSRSRELIDPARSLVAAFLDDATPPTPGRMAGEPHAHEPDEVAERHLRPVAGEGDVGRAPGSA